MKFSLKILSSLLILCAAGSASAQSVRPAEVKEVIAFYEWAFETPFTPVQRSKFQDFLQADFRSNAKKARQDTNTILDTWNKIQQIDENGQRTLREEFIRTYIEDLRVSDDADAKFLLGIYDATHQKSDSITGGDSRSGKKPNQQLTGKWWRSTGSGGNDDGTGKTRYNSGTKVTFEFFADGTMEYISDHETLSITQCKITEVMSARGTYSVSGDSLKIDFGPTKTVKSNSCKRSENGTKTVGASSTSMKYTVKEEDSVFRPDRPLNLCFQGNSGEVCYEKDIPYRQ